MKRRVRVKPTRTERRQRLARALDETGLAKRGVTMGEGAKNVTAPVTVTEKRERRPWRREHAPRDSGQGHGHGHEARGPGKQRRSLSMPRAAGGVGADGDPRWTGRLVQA